MSRISVWIKLLTVSIVAMGGVLPAFSAEGRIPVYLAGQVLGVDGKYIVARNILGGALVITGRHVDLDLNGFLVTNMGNAVPVISVAAALDAHVTIHNGVLSSGSVGIDVISARKVDIEDVKIHDMVVGAGQGIHLADVEGAAIRRTEITDTSGEGILWDSPAGVTKHGTIENNLLRRTAAALVILQNCSSIAILNNRLEEPGTGVLGAFPGFGIVLAGCGAALVSENTVQSARQDGIFLRNCKGNKLFDNVVRGCGANGIHIDAGSTDTLILNNVASGNGTAAAATGGSGLLVEGSQNLIERNLLNSNAGFGLQFCTAGVSCNNTFGRNMARGNTGALIGPCAACAGAPALFPPNSCNIACPAAALNSTFGDNLIPGPPIF